MVGSLVVEVNSQIDSILPCDSIAVEDRKQRRGFMGLCWGTGECFTTEVVSEPDLIGGCYPEEGATLEIQFQDTGRYLEDTEGT
jgi:hypothetical protein